MRATVNTQTLLSAAARFAAARHNSWNRVYFNEGVAKNLCARSRKCQVLQVLRKISLETCNSDFPIAPAKVIAQISHYGTAYECVAQAFHNGTT